MILGRTAGAALRQARTRAPIAARMFSSGALRRDSAKAPAKPAETPTRMKTFDEVSTLDDLLPPGAPVGTIPTDLNQSVGLERYELLGKMQGIDVWDMKPLDSSRKGTMEDPIVVKSIGLERYVGCSGGDTHTVNWMTISRSKPIERCIQCGNVIKMDYVGPDDPHHGHPPHVSEPEPEMMHHHIPPEYYYK